MQKKVEKRKKYKKKIKDKINKKNKKHHNTPLLFDSLQYLFREDKTQFKLTFDKKKWLHISL